MNKSVTLSRNIQCSNLFSMKTFLKHKTVNNVKKTEPILSNPYQESSYLHHEGSYGKH